MPAVHPLAIAGFIGALAAAHATVAVYALAVYARATATPAPRPSPASGRLSRSLPPRPDHELLIFGLLNLAVVVLDGGLATGHALAANEGARGLSAALLVAQVGRLAAIAFLLHFVVGYARVARPAGAVPGLYAAAAALAAGIVAAGVDARREDGRIFGVLVPYLHVRPTLPSVIAAAATVAAAVFALGLLGRAFLARAQSEALGLAGLALLMAALLWDALRVLGWTTGPMLAPLGYATFVNGVIMTLLSRFTALRGQLEGRARHLMDRARELGRAYAELRAAQDDLVRKEQLAAVGELSAVVAHEVRNPLAIISNAVATLRRSGIADADRDTLLGILDEESSRLNRLVGDLLRYARPVNLERQQVGLRELVERGMALVNDKLDVETELSEPEPTEKVWADPNLIRQVIDNLVSNAVQAMSGGGVLTVTLVNLELDGVRGVEIQIQDTGEGMDTQVRSRALDPFFTTRPSGTGLGLAIVARIVDAHGGVLRIKSKSGQGTVMHVFLPCASTPPRSLSDPGRPSSEPPLPAELRKSLGEPRKQL